MTAALFTSANRRAACPPTKKSHDFMFPWVRSTDDDDDDDSSSSALHYFFICCILKQNAAWEL